MSSFKRKSASASVASFPAGVRSTTHCQSVYTLSSGVASLDDVLGGGIPLGSVLIALAPDVHSAWGTLLLKYFIAQGLALEQFVKVISDASTSLVESCMWLPDSKNHNEESTTIHDDDNEEAPAADETISIAWRYEKMQPFQTTVVSNATASSGYCDSFDLTIKIPAAVISSARDRHQLSGCAPSQFENPFNGVLEAIECLAKELRSLSSNGKRRVTRIAIPDLGDPAWGDPSSMEILNFLHRLRTTIRSLDVVVFITLPPHLSAERPQFLSPRCTANSPPEHWHKKVGFMVDSCLLFTSFGSDPSLASLFKTYHGALQILRSPSLHTLLPPSQKHSVLRGLSSSSSITASTNSFSSSRPDAAGTGENNLAFRCTRKRFVIETLHLDAEGGVGERRTSAPPSAHGHTVLEADETRRHLDHDAHSHPAPNLSASARSEPGAANMHVMIELPPSASLMASNNSQLVNSSSANPETPRAIPRKKKVAFHSDRPDLYDF